MMKDDSPLVDGLLRIHKVISRGLEHFHQEVRRISWQAGDSARGVCRLLYVP